MTTPERRSVVARMTARHAVSERRGCRVLGFERSVMRYVPTRPAADAPWRECLRALAAQYPRWGGRACIGASSARSCA